MKKEDPKDPTLTTLSPGFGSRSTLGQRTNQARTLADVNRNSHDPADKTPQSAL